MMIYHILRQVGAPLLIAIALIMSTHSQSSAAANWQLIWSDEFDGPSGQSPEASKWDYDIGTDWGNAQLEYDTDRPSNVSLNGSGSLAITARQESYMGQPYTSARIVTRGLFEQTYGRIEARIKLPNGQGIWPAFWLLGSDIGSVGWPQCGEIDVMEYRGQETDVVHGSLHGPGYSAGNAITQAYVLQNGQFDSDFHIFAVEWDQSEIRWYVDAIQYHTVRPEDLGTNEWVFDHPFYVILNVAVGGTFVGSPDQSTVFPQTMLVDYVRVYQQGTGGDCCQERGNINGVGGIDIADLTYLVAYQFKGGATPPCPEEGNVNGIGVGLDGIDIADLTYLTAYQFKGGALPPDCPEPPIAPLSGAPLPTTNPADVISVFSDVYSNVTVDTWSADWDQADVTDYLVGADNIKKYTNLVFAGIEFASTTIDATAMTHFHMDVWTPDATAAPAVFKIKLVDFGANGVYDGSGDDVEHEIIMNDSIMNSSSWVSIDVPLSDFTNLVTREHLAQLLISGDLDTVYVDNIYFHR